MKKILTLVAVIFLVTTAASQNEVYGQQIHQLTHYMLNPFAFNPAVAGNSDQFISKVGFRKQWTGLEGSPTTGLLSVHGNFSEAKSIGVGAVLFFDNTGPTSRTGMQLAYAYHLPIVEDETYLGIGLSGNFMQYRINFADLILDSNLDPQLGGDAQGKFGADANFGLFLHNPSYWAGLSINQLFASKFTFGGVDENVQDARHFYLTGGYNFELTDRFDIEPSLLMKAVKGTAPQFDLNAKIYYKADSDNYDGGDLTRYWLGLSFRTEDALALMLGLNLSSGINFAYSYDITTSNLNKVSGGAHEISLGYNFSGGNRNSY